MDADLTLIAQRIAQAEGTGELNLEGISLREIPPEIQDLRHLRSVFLAGTGLRVLPPWFGNLKSIQVLDLAANPLKGFPNAILGLHNLQQLGLAGTGIVQLPDRIVELRQLEALVLSGNNILYMPLQICELPNLRFLDLGDNQIEDLPPEFHKLTWLTHLYLNGNPFRSVPEALRTARTLRVLDLSRTGQAGLPSSVVQIAGACALRRPPGQTENKYKPLTTLPNWLFSKLRQLEYLYLGNHALYQLPPSLPMLHNLVGLFIAGNRVGFPGALLQLAKIQYLDLRDNGITVAPQGLDRLSALRYLDLRQNDLPVPPEILEKPHEAPSIVDYLARVATNTRPLNEAKLLVVGEGSVGKSSLIRRLVRDDFDPHESKTEGIDITRWKLMVDDTETTLNTWDFGGQEIMHATHQFFLTRRSIYLLVIDVRQGEEQNRVEYWLKLIQTFSGGSPIIIVANKGDQAILDIDQRGLKNKYPDIVGIVTTSCMRATGINELRRLLTDTVRDLPHVRDLLPSAFFEVKEQLEEMESDYISIEDYEQLCREQGILSRGPQEALVGFLHDLGTVLCFRDDPRLADTHILNPSWVTGGVYRILNSHLAAQRKGLLRWNDIDKILDSREYPADRRLFIVDMMRRFELCYEAEGMFLVPDLLTKEEPDTGDWSNSLAFNIKYDVLPSNIMCRLIVRMNDAISMGTVWRNGVVLAMDFNRALVKADREDAIVTILVSGSAGGRRGLLTAVRSQIRSIERTMPGLTGTELVPVPDKPDIWVPYRHLLDLEAAGRPTVVPQGLVNDYSISSLLDGVEDPLERASSMANAANAAVDQDPTPAAENTKLNKKMLMWGIIGACAGVVAIPVSMGIALWTETKDENLPARPPVVESSGPPTSGLSPSQEISLSPSPSQSVKPTTRKPSK
ncbi:COR domain-containing protein [Dactylosporangium sp. NPDC005572]|uniref:COR domain-containing protein n=1 Tax=Dactylosporangium sp. NPDC005572 TaxID=3156889 RepID=UPI0033BB87C0